MGHLRVGRLPKFLRWREVVALLDDPQSTPQQIADAIAIAADRRLRGLGDAPSVGYPVWLLAHLTNAARGDEFVEELQRLEPELTQDSSSLAVVSGLTSHVRDELTAWPDRDHFSEISIQAFREALTRTVGREGASLFDGNAADVERAFRKFATRAGFAELARRYFSSFLERTLRAFVDRELAAHIGPARRLESFEATDEFRSALSHHVWQSSFIVEEFAGDWYSKHNYQSGGDISADEAQRFVAVALRKLRSELRREVGR